MQRGKSDSYHILYIIDVEYSKPADFTENAERLDTRVVMNRLLHMHLHISSRTIHHTMMQGSVSRLCVSCSRRKVSASALGQTNRRASTSQSPAMKVAIIGSGPSAFYSASRLLQLLPPESDTGKGLEIHMYERLPTPYGLVRYGVAPDHPEVKVCPSDKRS
jgi:NADPH-dependent glutamate synthase beta subunit-like oxidoreductase